MSGLAQEPDQGPARRRDSPARPARHIRWAVFLGPSLRLEEARAILDAHYLPPARRGDVWSILSPELEGIVLIDGVFHGQPAVWPRELLDALAGGVTVVGASSMGALRAAELAPFGMHGIGRVFDWYRDGTIEADDAVALLHGPEELGWAPMTIPLVNVRASLEDARAAGTLTGAECDAVAADADALPFQRRTVATLVEARDRAGWPPDRLEALRRLLGPGLHDVKAADARQALERVAGLLDGSSPLPGVDAVDPDHWVSLPPRWRLDRLLRASFDGLPGLTLARRLAADESFARRAALEALAEGWLALTAMDAMAARDNASAEADTDPPARPGAEAGLFPGEAAALVTRRRRLEAAVAAEDGAPVDRLRRVAARWGDAIGISAAGGGNSLAGADARAAPDPGALGLPWEPDVAILETWLADRLVGTPPWA